MAKIDMDAMSIEELAILPKKAEKKSEEPGEPSVAEAA